MTRRRVLTAIAVLGVVAVGLAIASPGSSRREPASADGGGGGGKALPPLKHHPQVVIAEAPGSIPPDTQFTYGSEPAAENFQPPSDAEVRRELHQLHVAKLGADGTYVDPFSQVAGLVPERIDMGVDYAGTGPVLALGSGTVFNTKGSGWPGGVFIGITLDAGPFAGLSYFVAEDVKPAVRVGDHVRAGQEIAVMYGGPAGIETGWASGHGDEPLAAALGQQNKRGDPGGWSSAAGVSFDRVLVSTGTPSGIPQGTKVHGKLSAPYP